MWTLAEVLRSQVDRTVKHIYTEGGKRFLEVTRLRKGDGKDIVVVPTQTSCRLGCRFCHLTGLDVQTESLTAKDMEELTSKTLLDVSDREPTLLVSFMGSGEPLLNSVQVLEAAELVVHYHGHDYQTVRFAVASLIPSVRRMRAFTNEVETTGFNVKFHWSLHSVDAEARRNLMPAAVPVNEAVALVEEYAYKTGNAVEAHYTLIEGVNDRYEDAEALGELLDGTPITLKILRLSERPGEPLARSNRLEPFLQMLKQMGIQTEYYEPPGYDIGSACGQFLTRYYEAPKVKLPVIQEAL